MARVPGDGPKLNGVKAAMERHAGCTTKLIVVEVMVTGRNMICGGMSDQWGRS